MDRFEYFKDLYYRELDRVNEIDHRLSVPMGLIITLVAALYFLVTHFSYGFSFPLTLAFILFILVSLVYLCFCLFFLIQAYVGFPNGYRYSGLANVNELENYFQELKNYYLPIEGELFDPIEEWKDYLLRQMIRTTGINQKFNWQRNQYKHICERNLTFSFLGVCMALVFFGISLYAKPTKNTGTDLMLLEPVKQTYFLIKTNDDVLH